MSKTCLESGQACSCAKYAPNSVCMRNNGIYTIGIGKRLFEDSRAEMGATPIPPQPERGNSLPSDDTERGKYPMADGCLDYFPNALAEVSKISYEGNEKHNPGKPMHWARGKSTDHRNKIIRHTVDSLPETEVAIEHAAQAAWRALAYLQEKIERVRSVQVSGASR
jgi:hypothetical protein